VSAVFPTTFDSPGDSEEVLEPVEVVELLVSAALPWAVMPNALTSANKTGINRNVGFIVSPSRLSMP
jgi:hypothetical protein